MMRMIKEVEIRILLDYLKELRELNSGGYSAHREIAETIKELREVLAFDKSVQLLTIELETIDGVPKIHYKGNPITLVKSIDFDWLTKDRDSSGLCRLSVEHYLDDGAGKPVLTEIKEVR